MAKGNETSGSAAVWKSKSSDTARDFPLPAWLKNARPGGIRGRKPVRAGTKTPGAYRAGANGVYVFRFLDLKTRQTGATAKSGKRKPGDLYAAHTESAVIEGEKIGVSLAHEKAGMGSRPHHHPNDQFIFVLKGTLRVRIASQPEMLVPAGSVVYFPANVVHSSGATADEDVISYVCKDLAWEFGGIPVDKSRSGPQTGFAAVGRRSRA